MSAGYILLSLVVPLAKLGYMICARAHKLEVVQVHITTSMGALKEDAKLDGADESLES
jgi:hypothetical protein